MTCYSVHRETKPIFLRAINSSDIGGRKKFQNTRYRSATRTKSNFEALLPNISMLYCRFSHDVTKIQTTKLLILLIFYFNEV